jgi:hypothetical protein
LAAWVHGHGVPQPRPVPAGAFAFAAFGDTPYDHAEERRYRFLLRALAADDLAFVLHVGDVFWYPCSDAHYQETLAGFMSLPHPLVYTPGDNEWADCWERGSGGFAPRERLARLRQVFFSMPPRALGGRTLALASQGGSADFPEFVENARWTTRGFLFATVHLVGSLNGLRLFSGRTADDDAEVARRTAAAAAWTRQAFREARATGAAAVVIAFQADIAFNGAPDDPERKPYEPFLAAVAEEAASFPRPILLVHGDGHEFIVDHPLRGADGRALPQVTRLEVPGSPDVGWVRVIVTPAAPAPFAFERYVVPSWKLW